MAEDNSTGRDKPETYYFDRPEHSPRIDMLIYGLDGVCKSLAAWDGSTNDDDEVERIANLSQAAAVLTHELMMRLSTKPCSKRELAEARKVQTQWREARGRLAGPTEGSA